MTQPCWRCGAARSCDHREVDPPVIPPTLVATGDKPTHYAERKPRDYSGNRFNFGTRKRKYDRDRA